MRRVQMKRVRNCYYVHQSCIEDLLNVAVDKDRRMIADFIQYCRSEGNQYFNSENYPFDYIFKYDKANHKLSQIECFDFNEEKEPTVDDSYVLDLSTMEVKKVNSSRKNPQIYHSKELFVHEDYKGFDIEEARQRTKEWNAIPNLDKKKIGRRNYWTQLLVENNMEV